MAGSDPDHLIVRQTPIDPEILLRQHAARKVTIDGRACSERDLAALAVLRHATHVQLTGMRSALGALAALPRLEQLHLVDPHTLEGLSAMPRLTSLTIYCFPKIHSLAPIASLVNLRSLLLSTPPGYDASRKCHDVDSLQPLEHLRYLERLTLRGILPARGRLSPLSALTQLRELAVTHVYAFGLEDYAGLARALPATSGHCLRPYFAAHWTGRCRACGRPRVALTAPPPRTPRTLCPDCDRARLERHVANWNDVMSRS